MCSPTRPGHRECVTVCRTMRNVNCRLCPSIDQWLAIESVNHRPYRLCVLFIWEPRLALLLYRSPGYRQFNWLHIIESNSAQGQTAKRMAG